MKVTAANYRMLYLTANQVQNLHRMFIINGNYQVGGDTNEAYANPLEYQSYINPVITETKGEKVEIEETCLTIPFIRFVVPRFS